MGDDSRDSRATERRIADRRQTPRRATDESLFGALGVSADSQGAPESFFDPGWVAAGDLTSDSRFLTREARRIVAAQDNALARIYRTYAAARAAIGIGLVATQVVTGWLAVRAPVWLALVCIAYAVQAVTLWLLPRFEVMPGPHQAARQRRLQWLSTIGVDLLAFTTLHMLESGTSFNFAALLVLPVLMAGVVTQRLLALATAAGVTLMLLLVAWRSALLGGDPTALLLQSGLAGMGLFIIALLSGELAGRLAREELAARGSLELARQQAQLNRLVIEEMVDGVIVIDRRLRARAANPAARRLLVGQGLSPPAPFTLDDRPAWAALAQAVTLALGEGAWPEAGRDVTLAFDDGHTRTVRLRVRFMRGRGVDEVVAPGGTGGPEQFVVLLLEDVRTAMARLRQEKLAAMGRMSAGIAHEIRNPLAAISQANALMLEDDLAPTQRLLARMVGENAERLRRIVDDVLEVAPGVGTAPQAIDAVSLLAAGAAEWARTAGLAPGSDSRLRIDLPAPPLVVLFDPEHLRRVLVNLLDNAGRHAGAAPGAIFLRLAVRDDHTAVLSVLSDSAPIPPEVERHLFEPFFSTRSRGSGLGLYICRELCERYGASIEYRPRPGAERLRNEFVVTMQRSVKTEGDMPADL
jgi:two-component system, NtrC family, sensor histidine kinase PilS